MQELFLRLLLIGWPESAPILLIGCPRFNTFFSLVDPCQGLFILVWQESAPSSYWLTKISHLISRIQKGCGGCRCPLASSERCPPSLRLSARRRGGRRGPRLSHRRRRLSGRWRGLLSWQTSSIFNFYQGETCKQNTSAPRGKMILGKFFLT